MKITKAKRSVECPDRPWSQKDRARLLGLSNLDTKVCKDCIREASLKKLVQRYGNHAECSYCMKERLVVPTNYIVDEIYQGLQWEYEDPANNVMYESREGDYLLHTQDLQDILIEELSEELSEDLLEDIVQAFPLQEWVHHDPYGLPDHIYRSLVWEEFCEQLKHETRYVFFRAKHANKSPDIANEPYQVLQYIAKSVKSLRLIRRMPAQTTLYRVRCHNRSRRFSSASELGAPPIENAINANRMSPAGISMFYCALRDSTAILETADFSNIRGTVATTGTFELTREIRLLDLTKLPPVPSLFDNRKRQYRSVVKFLRKFVNELARKVTKDEHIHIEYVPTQVLTEFFRRVFRTSSGDIIDGILYPSSIDGNPACVLFFGNADCANINDPAHKSNNAVLLLRSVSSQSLKKWKVILGV